MTEERDLKKLLAQMAPAIHQDLFVFCTFADRRVPSSLEPLATFQESEGLTAIVPKHQAESLGLPLRFESRLITLTVQSSLEAVGLLARVTSTIAAEGISCNVVSGYYHDHIFVPREKAEIAYAVL
jgi:hypothetical protein